MPEASLNRDRVLTVPFYGAFALTMLGGTLLLGGPPRVTHVQAVQMGNMPGMQTKATGPSANLCDDMGGREGTSVMGESMAAMTNHMCVTPKRAGQPGDEERAKAVVDQVRAAIERYRDSKKAIADGYVQANPTVDPLQFHFNSDANAKLADTAFDPTRPTSLLYYRTPTQRFKLEGVMFTARPNATEDELNARVPLSVARWHKHTNFCGAPANKVKGQFGEHPKFGMFGSIHTKDACEAEGGTFFPAVFTWMVHVFPYEKDLNDQFSMNHDVLHTQ